MICFINWGRSVCLANFRRIVQGPFHVPSSCLLYLSLSLSRARFVEERQIKGRRRVRAQSRCSFCSRYWVILLFPVFFDSGRCSLQDSGKGRSFDCVFADCPERRCRASILASWDYLTDSIRFRFTFAEIVKFKKTELN